MFIIIYIFIVLIIYSILIVLQLICKYYIEHDIDALMRL